MNFKKFLLKPITDELDKMLAAASKKCQCGESLEEIGSPGYYSRLKLLGCPKCHLVYWFWPEELTEVGK